MAINFLNSNPLYTMATQTLWTASKALVTLASLKLGLQAASKTADLASHIFQNQFVSVSDFLVAKFQLSDVRNTVINAQWIQTASQSIKEGCSKISDTFTVKPGDSDFIRFGKTAVSVTALLAGSIALSIFAAHYFGGAPKIYSEILKNGFGLGYQPIETFSQLYAIPQNLMSLLSDPSLLVRGV